MNQTAPASIVRTSLVTIYVIFLIILAGYLVTMAAQADVLILAAIPFPLLPILGLHFLRPNETRAGWAGFTVWLGGTYAMGGEHAEVMVFGLITAMAVAGYYRSTWLFVLAWFGHALWDFMPRELPEMLADLPVACLIFDSIIGAYLVWMTLKKPGFQAPGVRLAEPASAS